MNPDPFNQDRKEDFYDPTIVRGATPNQAQQLQRSFEEVQDGPLTIYGRIAGPIAERHGGSREWD